MKIGIDLRLHAYAPGGISRYARRIARSLAGLLEPGTLTLVHHRRDDHPLALSDVRSYAAWTPPHHNLEKWALGAELLPLKLDLFHSTDFIPPAFGAQRLVITVHDLNFLYYPEYLTSDARRYYNDQIGWAVERANAIIVDSEATRQDLHKLLDVAPEGVTVAHLAADARFRVLPSFKISAVLERYELPPDYLLFVGVWEPRKNLSGLLEALRLLHARGYNLPLVAVGRRGWLYEEIFDKVESLGLSAWVRFIENPPVNDLVGLYNAAQLLVLPSFYEGFGLPVLEAMQCGTPVVASDRASLPEIVGEAGILINPEDPAAIAGACARVVRDVELQRALYTAGLARATNFSWRATAKKTLLAYQAALQD
ncbi:MAG: glycosyltransferase family 4 protein [Anaerolineae bacterium]